MKQKKFPPKKLKRMKGKAQQVGGNDERGSLVPLDDLLVVVLIVTAPSV